MGADPDLAAVAVLIGDPARATMLSALLGGVALPAGELAYRASVSPQTASSHLAKLVEGGLLIATSTGRHRYYALASAKVARVLEALATIAPPPRPRSFRETREMGELRYARTCYDHLAGRVGVALTQALLDDALILAGEEGYTVTGRGTAWLRSWGIEPSELEHKRRVFAKPCLDWSERRFHLAGALGAAVTQSLIERGWITRVPGGRAVRLTEAGLRGLIEELRIPPGDLTPVSRQSQ